MAPAAAKPGWSALLPRLWPLVALAQYLIASGDAAVLDAQVPFFDNKGPDAGERASVWQHVERALAVTDRRRIPGTKLAAYVTLPADANGNAIAGTFPTVLVQTSYNGGDGQLEGSAIGRRDDLRQPVLYVGERHLL